MLRYPDWFTAVDRASIDAALNRAYAATRPDIDGSFWFASEAAAQHEVLDAFKVVVEVLSLHRTLRDHADLRSTAHYLLDEVIWRLDKWRPSEGPLPDFASAVRTERDAQSWWRQFVDSGTEVVDSVTEEPPTNPRAARMHRPRRAAWLAEQMRLAGQLTPNRLQELGGPDHKTTRLLLEEGRGTDREEVLRRIVRGLNEANSFAGRTVTFTLADIPRD